MPQKTLLNEKELQIISELRTNARESLTRLSRKTGIPVSTIFDKVRKNMDGVMTRSTCLIDFGSIGFNTRAKVMLKAARENRDELRQYLARNANVNSLYKINSGYDFLMEGVFRNMNEAEEFMEGLREKFGIVEDKVFYVLEDIKREEFLTCRNVKLV